MSNDDGDECNKSNPTYYCDNTISGCFLEKCVGALSNPPQDDNCPALVNSCSKGDCSTTTCSAGDMTSCRSNANGQGTAGVCNTTSGLCEVCFITTYSTEEPYEYVDNCPGKYNRCIWDLSPFTDAAKGPYCMRASCTPWTV